MGNSLIALAGNLREDQADRLRCLEFLVNSSPMVIYTCVPYGDFGATFVSAGIKVLWGYEPEEFLGEKDFWIHHVHPGDAPKVRDEIRRLFVAGRHSHEYRFRTKSGEYCWVHDELRLIRDASGEPLEIVGHCIDITARKAVEEALRESEARLKLIFNSTSDLQALFRAESGDEFVTEALNQTICDSLKDATGREGADFIGRDFAELLSATGLSASEIEERRALYAQARESGVPITFESPASKYREPAEIWLYPIQDESNRCTRLLWNGRVITERLKAEAALRESEERYALVTQATHDGIYDWNLVTGKSYVSPRFKEILGFGNELPDDRTTILDLIHPEDRSVLANSVARVETDSSFFGWSEELRFRCRDGSYRWVVSRGKVVREPNGHAVRVVGSIRDITERLEASAKLEANKKRLRDIVNSLDGFVGLYTLDGVTIEVNQASLRAGGFQPEDVIGKRPWETMWCGQGTEEESRVREAISMAARGETGRYEGPMRTHDGRQLIVDVSFSPLRDFDGVITHIIGFGVDITQRKEAEVEVRLAKQMAEAANQAKSEFLANMSHEIRTPMNGIIGLTEVVLDSPLNAEQREYLGLVKTSAESLLHIISDILDISKLQTGKVILQPKEFWLKDMLNATLKVHAVAAQEKNLVLRWDVSPEIPELLLGDSNCLRQVIRNVVGNAIKFTERGEVAVHVTAMPEDPGVLRFSVRDTGIGIAANKLQSVFEPFSQVDSSRQREFGGAGLGLAIAAQLVEMMRGEIWVESDVRIGSTFYFTVRMGAVSSDPADRRREIRELKDGPAWVEISSSPAAIRREVRVVDVSKGGMKLRSEERFEAGSVIQIHMDELAGPAEVCYSVAGANGFLTGIRLLDN